MFRLYEGTENGVKMQLLLGFFVRVCSFLFLYNTAGEGWGMLGNLSG